MRKRTVLGLAVFLLGGLALGGVIYLRTLLAGVEVTSVVLRPRLSLTSPGLSCTIRGHNPLPLSITVSRYRVEIGTRELPVALLLSSEKAVTMASGDFEIDTSLSSDGRSAGVKLGDGISTGLLRGVGYGGSMTVGVGPLSREVALKGKISWFK